MLNENPENPVYKIQDLVGASLWGFESPLSHQQLTITATVTRESLFSTCSARALKNGLEMPVFRPARNPPADARRGRVFGHVGLERVTA